MKNSACNLWAKGNCFRGKNCYFKHDQAKKGTQRQTAPADEDAAGGAAGSPESVAPPLPETGVSQGVQYISDTAKAAAPLINFRVLRLPFVTQRPSACVDLSGSGGEVMHRQTPQGAVYDCSKSRQSLPVVKPPGPGYCHASVLSPMLLPETNVRVIWDGGAEGISISDKCMSRILRNQSQAGIPDELSAERDGPDEPGTAFLQLR